MDIVPVDYESPVGTVRGLISDTVQFDFDQTGVIRYRMSDAQLQSYITLAGATRLYAASAHALRAQAALEVTQGKVWKTEDLQVDGAKTADALRLLAREYDGRQKVEDDELAFTENAFEIVDTPYPYTNMEW